jgi:uncharacterized protein (TIGR01777 family)
MKLGITGASGFIGSRVAALAAERGWEVTVFTRHPSKPSMRRFSLDEPIDVHGLDAILHLAGEPVFGLWTAEKRRRIMDSRVLGTRRLVEGFARAEQPPRVLVSGSAIGFYGDTGDHEVDESSPGGTGFLAEVTHAWEAEARKTPGARVALMRTGYVLGRDGGAMKVILPVFRAGLGGRLGSGRQWMSCIHVDDVARMALWAVEDETVAGPFNAVMPRPCTNAEFTKTVARAVHRPAILPAPALALRIFLGGMSSLMLDSLKVRPGVALARDYRYAFPQLDAALDNIAH